MIYFFSICTGRIFSYVHVLTRKISSPRFVDFLADDEEDILGWADSSYMADYRNNLRLWFAIRKISEMFIAVRKRLTEIKFYHSIEVELYCLGETCRELLHIQSSLG